MTRLATGDWLQAATAVLVLLIGALGALAWADITQAQVTATGAVAEVQAVRLSVASASERIAVQETAAQAVRADLAALRQDVRELAVEVRQALVAGRRR